MAADAATGDADDYGRVFNVVEAGGTFLLLRQVIEDCAQGSAARRKAAVDTPGPSGELPLQAAHRLGLSSLVGELLQAGATVGDTLGGGGLGTALAVAIAHGEVETLSFLFRTRQHDPTEEVAYAPPGWAAEEEEEEEEADAAAGDDGEGRRHPTCTLAHLCVAPPAVPPHDRTSRVGPPQVEALRRVAAASIDAHGTAVAVNRRDSRGATPLFWLPAAVSDHGPLLVVLLSFSADPNAAIEVRQADGTVLNTHSSPLISVLERGAPNMSFGAVSSCARKLIEAGAAITGVFSEHDDPPIVLAAKRGWPAVVRLLLRGERRAPVNECGLVHRVTPLHVCADAHPHDPKFFALQELLSAGAEPNFTDARGRTPLCVCCAKGGWWSGMERLLKAGAWIDVRDNDGMSPLAHACSAWARGHTHMWPMPMELLRRSSADTRRAVTASDGFSAADLVVVDFGESRLADPIEKTRYESLLTELLLLGVPLLPKHAAKALPCIVAQGVPRAARAEARLAEMRAPHNRWRAHEDLAGLAMDHQELRAAERAEERSRRRVRRLELALELADMLDEDEEGEEGEGGERAGPGAGGVAAAAAMAAVARAAAARVEMVEEEEEEEA